MQDLILETVEDAIFTENKRIKELIEFTSSSNDRSIIQNGHMLAMGHAASQLNEYASTLDMMSGVRFISNLNNISKHIGENNNLNIFSNMLESMHKKVAESPSISYLASSLDANTLNLKNNYLKSADWFDQDLNSIKAIQLHGLLDHKSVFALKPLVPLSGIMKMQQLY